MRILGIETSCDETSAAVVEETGNPAAPWAMRSNVVASQVAIHAEWGGVVPELASRQHLRDICAVVDRALIDAGSTWGDLGAIAVTQGPGLVGSLLVGVSFAKAAAAAANLPLVAVHHLAGHIESLVLQNGELPLPAVVLVVSGGHTSLYLVEHPGSYQLLSRTRDDAAGEAYDKVAKLLGLGYPGGPVLDRLARTGNDRAIALPTTRLTHAELLLVHVADGWAARNFDQLKLRESEEMKSDRAYLDGLCADLAREGFTASSELAMGDPSTELVRAAEEHHVDLIAMSTHGHRFLSDIVHGTTADRVRHLVKVPVLLLRAQ